MRRRFVQTIVMGLVLLFVAFFVREAFHAHQLNVRFERGPVVKATGTITELSIGSGAHYSHTYWLGYQYAAPDGRHDTMIVVPESAWKSLHTGNPIPVEYLTADPAVSRIATEAAEKSRQNDVAFALGAAVFILLLGSFATWKMSHGRNS